MKRVSGLVAARFFCRDCGAQMQKLAVWRCPWTYHGDPSPHCGRPFSRRSLPPEISAL